MSVSAGPVPLREEVIAPTGHFAAELRAGQVLRIVDIEGQQVADLVCFALGALDERLSIVNTISLNRQVFPRVGNIRAAQPGRSFRPLSSPASGVHSLSERSRHARGGENPLRRPACPAWARSA